MLSVKRSIFTAVVREKLTEKEILKQAEISTSQLEKDLDVKARVFLEHLENTMEGISVDKRSGRTAFRGEHGSLTLSCGPLTKT